MKSKAQSILMGPRGDPGACSSWRTISSQHPFLRNLFHPHGVQGRMVFWIYFSRPRQSLILQLLGMVLTSGGGGREGPELSSGVGMRRMWRKALLCRICGCGPDSQYRPPGGVTPSLGWKCHVGRMGCHEDQGCGPGSVQNGRGH